MYPTRSGPSSSISSLNAESRAVSEVSGGDDNVRIDQESGSSIIDVCVWLVLFSSKALTPAECKKNSLCCTTGEHGAGQGMMVEGKPVFMSIRE